MAMTIQETFRQANLKSGEKYTLLFTNDFSFPCVQKVTLESVEETSYAQYKDAVRLVFRPCKKRTFYQKYFYGEKRFAILKGWHDIQTAKEVTTASGFTYMEMCSGDFSFIINACKEHAEDVVINYEYEPEVQEVTEALVVRMVDGRMIGEVYELKDLANHFEVTGKTGDLSEERKHRLCRRAELDNQPILKGFCGPMYDGGRIRYEDSRSNDILSA